jgi:hypothetical protein
MQYSHGFLHHLTHNFDWAFETEALMWTHVQLQRYDIQLFLAVYRQVCALGQVLTNQAVDIFVTASLQGTVGVAEEYRHTGFLGDLGVPRHLPSLVVGHALAQYQRHAIEHCTEALYRRGRRRVVHLHQHQVATGALRQLAYRRGIGLTLDQIAFLMPWHQPNFDLWRAHMNADHLRDLPAPIHAARTRPDRRLALAQADDQLLTQLADRQGIDHVIDRLSTDVGISAIWHVHAAQLAGNLLGRKRSHSI